MFRKAVLTAIVFITLATSCLSESFKATGAIDAYFSPSGGATEAIVKEINSAKNEILAQDYFFTSKPIAKAGGIYESQIS